MEKYNLIWEVGKNYLIRTVTMTLTGKLEVVGEKELVLSSAAWIADLGRFTQAVEQGTFSEVEPYPLSAKVIVGRSAVIDAVIIDYPLPQKQK
jgi:hypothetical protein